MIACEFLQSAACASTNQALKGCSESGWRSQKFRSVRLAMIRMGQAKHVPEMGTIMLQHPVLCWSDQRRMNCGQSHREGDGGGRHPDKAVIYHGLSRVIWWRRRQSHRCRKQKLKMRNVRNTPIDTPRINSIRSDRLSTLGPEVLERNLQSSVKPTDHLQ